MRRMEKYLELVSNGFVLEFQKSNTVFMLPYTWPNYATTQRLLTAKMRIFSGRVVIEIK